MICLCERDMTCLGGELEHCRVRTKGQSALPAPTKPNVCLPLDFRLNFHASAIDQFDSTFP